jgi:predicted glycosyltransferase
MVVVTGPRLLPEHVLDGAEPPEGLEVRPYVPDLWKHLSVCDLAVVQSGLTTTMELVAARRPFLHIPLRHHFEQQYHVAHRLRRYGADEPLDYDDATPERLGALVAERIGRPVDYLPVAPGGAERIAARLAELI